MPALLQSEKLMETTRENALIRYWQLIVVLMGLGVSAGVMQTQLNVLAQEVNEQSTEIHAVEEKEQNTATDVATIKATQEAIKDDVEEIKEDLKDQDKKLDRIIDKLNEG